MVLRAAFLTTLACLGLGAFGHAPERRGLFYCPAINGQYIVFVRGNELWRVPRTGGEAVSLHAWASEYSLPKFSPDGRRVALLTHFSGAYELGTISIDGGDVFRVTHYPRNGKGLMQWLPNGRLLYFTEADFRYVESQLYTVPATGGLPTKLPVPYGADASLKSDGEWLAYILHMRRDPYWKHYHGGMAPDIWLYNLRTGKSKQVTTWKGYDVRPMWVGERLYYVSDAGPEGFMNIWSYDPATGKRSQITHGREADVQNPYASEATHEIAYQRGGDIWVLDLSTGKERRIDIKIPPSSRAIPTRKIDASAWTANRALSPDGSKVVVEARGDLWLCPAGGGDRRNLTHTNGVFERDPAWSPDGMAIACFSDMTGEYQLTLVDPGSGALKTLTSFKSGFRQTPKWSPDSSRIAFTDNASKMYVCTVATGEVEAFDADPFGQVDALNWSPDSQWITYHKFGRNGQSAIWLYNVATKRKYQATSGMAQDFSPVFDTGGNYLFYFSYRDFSRRIGQLMESLTVYPTPTVVEAVPLRKDLRGPVGGSTPSSSTQIDLDGFEGRGVQLPLASGRFNGSLAVVGRRVVYLRDNPMQPAALQLFDLDTGVEKTILPNAEWFQLSEDGKKVLAGLGGKRYVLDVAPDQKPGPELADTGLDVNLDPVAEWEQIARDAWRLFRDYFYDPKMHGLDWEATWRRFQPMFALCATRDDVNYVIGEMISELSVGHAMMTGPGDVGDEPWTAAGQLGVDFELANGAYRITKIYQGAAWDSLGRGPLSGVGVNEGDYLLAVEGKPLDTNVDPWAPFMGMAGKTVSITVSAQPRIDASARTVKVKLIERESDLRLRDWVERNRQYVEKASGGKLGYLYLPDESATGNAEFVRQFYGQTDKEGLVVDVRWTTGGTSSDRMIEMLNRPLLNAIHERYSVVVFPVPTARIPGPKCLLINRVSSSSGENFAYYFRKSGLGKLIGTRTWGGLIGVNGNQSLIDGGYWWVPQSAFFVDQKRWMPEGIGIEPDITVMDDPALMRDGKDPQLDAAINYLLGELRKHPNTPIVHPEVRSRAARGAG